MVYAITVVTVAIFFAIYLLTREKPREKTFSCLKESEYNEACDEYARESALPKEGSSTKDKYYKRNIKFIEFCLKNKKYKGVFDDFLENKDVLQPLLKMNYSSLANLASVDNEPRCVNLARFCLAQSDYIFIADRVKTLFDAQNKVRTLSFSEIMAMKEAFLYVLLEKTYFIYNDLRTIAKAMKIAKKYAKDDGLLASDKKYKDYSKSKLFLSLCAIESNYGGESHKGALVDTADRIYRCYTRVVDSIQCILYYDFSRHYSPLEIFDKFESFVNATETQKINFLSLFSKLSDKENIDEFMYAVRAEKYMQTSSAGHIDTSQKTFFGTRFCLVKQKENLSMLAVALKSDAFMKLYFDDKNNAKKFNTITKIVDFENTFEPVYKFSNVNFGLSVNGDVLRVSPHLPKNVVSADLVFQANDVYHHLKIKRGEQEKLYLGNTLLKGTHLVKLAKKPLDVTVVVKE